MASEGCVIISAQGHASLFVSQKYPNILNAIRDFFKCGNVSAGKWSVTNRDDVEIVARRLLGVSGAKDKVLAILVEYLALQTHHDVHGLGGMHPDDIDSRRKSISDLNGGSQILRAINVSRSASPKRSSVTPKYANSEIVGYWYRDAAGIKRCFTPTRHRTLDDAKELAMQAQDAVARAKARRRRDRIEGFLIENNLE